MKTSWHNAGLAALAGAVFSAVIPATPARAQEAVGRVVTLEEAVSLALRVDPAAVVAEGAVSTASADMLQARGAWLPSLTVGSSYSNSSNQRFDQATGQLVSESYTAQAQASMELFSGGRRIAQHRVASAGLRAADATLRAQHFRTRLLATQSYYAAVAAAELERAARQRLERAKQQLSFAETRLEVGTATRSDQLRAELEVGNAELALVDAEAALHSARLALGRTIGVAGEVGPAAQALPERAPALPPLEALTAQAEQSSPEAVAATAALESRRAERLASLSAYVPSIRLTAGYDWFAFQFPPDQRSWSVRLFTSYPLFNGFQREAQIDRASAAARSAEARSRDARIGVRAAVEDAAREVGSAERRVSIAQRAVALAREDLRVQEERYQIGAATIVELQTSQIALAEAEVAEIQARRALGVAVAQLESLLGQRLGEEG